MVVMEFMRVPLDDEASNTYRTLVKSKRNKVYYNIMSPALRLGCVRSVFVLQSAPDAPPPPPAPRSQKLLGQQQAEFRVTLHCVWTSGGQMELLRPTDGGGDQGADQENREEQEGDMEDEEDEISDLEPDAQ